MIQRATINITASDVSGQRRVHVCEVPADSSIGELLDGLIPRLLPGRRNGGHEKPLHVEARLEREGRHLHRSERVGDALETDDHLVLHPAIMAG
jgi:hypothetical protein